MSGRATKSMSREKIQQLLKAIGSEPKEDTAQVDATDYNWQEPHYFNNEQLVKLDNFADAAALGMSQKFAKLCRSEFNVTISSTTQHYASDILSQLLDGEQQDYYLPFGLSALWHQPGAYVWAYWHTRANRS